MTKTDFDTKLNKISDRITLNKSKHLLVENELKKLKTFDLSYFKGKNYFEGNDGAQNTLVFQTMQKHFNLSNKNQISKRKSKELSIQYLKSYRNGWRYNTKQANKTYAYSIQREGFTIPKKEGRYN